jgi:dCTP deaminase
MAFWRGETLKTRLPTLIAPFDINLIDINAYTLRMGSEYYCTSDGKRSLWDRAVKQILPPGKEFIIPAGQFAFLQTAEQISVPDDAMAFISIKAKIKFEGLINVSGFHVDPGYQGHLVFSVFNAGSSPITLEEGQPLFLIWYASLDAPTKMLKGPNDSKTISRELIRGMSQEILSMQSLSAEIAKLRNDMRLQYAIFTIAGGVMLAIIVGALNDTVHEVLHPSQKTGQSHVRADVTLSVPSGTTASAGSFAIPVNQTSAAAKKKSATDK